MKKINFISLIVLLLISLQSIAQEQQPTQKKKEKAKKECNVNGKKCCASQEKKGCDSADAPKVAVDAPKEEHTNLVEPKKTSKKAKKQMK
jgi:hypothetical protein